MTAKKAVVGDRVEPTRKELDTYKRREAELRLRFEKGILDNGVILDGLQKLMEMTRGVINCNGQPEIPSWAHRENPIIKHHLCGMIDPARFEAADIFDGEDYLDGEEFVRRGQALEGAENACAFDFYAKSENWKYLEHVPIEVTVLVFVQTIFRDSRGNRCVWCLCRDGAEWDRGSDRLRNRFDRGCRVARRASSQALKA